MKESIFQSFLRTIPPLRHSVPGELFDLSKSELINWLVAQPQVREWLYHKVRYSGRVTFDAASGVWRGATVDETEGLLETWRQDRKKRVKEAKAAKKPVTQMLSAPDSVHPKANESSSVPKSSALFAALSAHSEVIEVP